MIFIPLYISKFPSYVIFLLFEEHCVGILQRNHRRYLYVYVSVYIYIYTYIVVYRYGKRGLGGDDKELSHTLVEAGECQDLQGELVSWRLKRADNVVPA